MAITKAPAYFTVELITVVKGYMIWTPVACTMNVCNRNLQS